MGSISSPRSAARHVAAAVLVGIVASSVPGAEATTTTSIQDPVGSARASRQAAEDHLAELERQRAALEATIAERAGATAEIVDALAQARRDLRQNAVEAYIAGGASDQLSLVLTSEDLTEAADRVNFLDRRTVNAADAIARFEQLKNDNDPENVKLAAQLDALDAGLADARDGLYQATANEADAERAVALEAASRAAAARAAASRAAASPTVPPTTVRPSGAATPTPTTRAPTASPSTSSTTSAPAALGSFTAPSWYRPAVGVGPTPEGWARLRACESGGNYASVSGSGRYRGAYQFDRSTWENLGGIGDPATAPPADQDLAAAVLYSIRGARAWPSCGGSLV